MAAPSAAQLGRLLPLLGLLLASCATSSRSPISQSWATPIFEDELAPSIAAALRLPLLELAAELEGTQPAGRRKSNVGGWQSAPLPLGVGSNPVVDQLAEHILDAARWFVAEGLGDDLRRQRALLNGEYRLELASLWLNVNRPRDYNNPHVHTDSFLSGVYYVQVGPQPLDEESGGSTLVLSDPRVQLQQFEYFDWYAALCLPRRVPGCLLC